jgi:prevent-host-death family protein
MSVGEATGRSPAPRAKIEEPRTNSDGSIAPSMPAPHTVANKLGATDIIPDIVDCHPTFVLRRLTMDSTYSVTQAQTNLPRLIKEATKEGSIAITRHEETVAYLISRGRMDAIMETLELLGDPEAAKALRDYEEGKTRFLPLAALDGDKG